LGGGGGGGGGANDKGTPPSGSKLTFEMKTFDFLSLNFKAKEREIQ
jgi:hypothetical protein